MTKTELAFYDTWSRRLEPPKQFVDRTVRPLAKPPSWAEDLTNWSPDETDRD